MRESSNLKRVSDDELLRRLSDLVTRSRRVDADVVAHIAEVDARRLYARQATPSMFAYCLEVLRFGENEAYLRIAAARASREYPVLLEMLRAGRLHLSAVARLASHLTPDNWEAVLERAAHRSKREIEELIAELSPRPDARSTIRKLPQPRTQSAPNAPSQLVPERVESVAIKAGSSDSSAAQEAAASHTSAASCAAPAVDAVVAPTEAMGPSRPAWRATIEPLAPSRHRVQFTASDELRGKLEQLQALMRETVPDGDLATLIDVAVTEKLERLKAKRFAETRRPKKTLGETDPTPASRHIPAAVRRAVKERDEGQCTYEDARGRRCRARERLEFHHHGRPYGKGGEHSVENVRLMCRTHNRLLAEVEYGKEKMGRYRRRGADAGLASEMTAVYGGCEGTLFLAERDQRAPDRRVGGGFGSKPEVPLLMP